MTSRSQARLGRSILLHLVLTPLALVWLFPLWMMVVFSTMPDNGIFSPGIELLPHDGFLDNFNNLQRDTNFVGAIGISVSVAVTYTFLSVLLTSMAGWALARYEFLGKGAVEAIIFGTISRTRRRALLTLISTILSSISSVTSSGGPCPMLVALLLTRISTGPSRACVSRTRLSS